VALADSDPDPEEATPSRPGDVPDVATAAFLGLEFADRDVEPLSTGKTNECAYDDYLFYAFAENEDAPRRKKAAAAGRTSHEPKLLLQEAQLRLKQPPTRRRMVQSP
jgi:hypothetical protein